MFPFAWTVNILSITTALPLDFPFQLLFAQRAMESTPRTCAQGVERGKEEQRPSQRHEEYGHVDRDCTRALGQRHIASRRRRNEELLRANIQSHKTSSFKQPTAVNHHHTALILFKGVPPSQPSSGAHLSIYFFQPNQSEGGQPGTGRPLCTMPGLGAVPIPVGASSSWAGQLCPIPAELNDSGAPENPSPLFQCREVTGNICKQYICTLPMVSKSKGC